MLINTVKSLEDSFTGFKRVVYAYVWVFIKKESDDEFDFSQYWEFNSYISTGEDEKEIWKKVNEYLREFYQEDDYFITNVIPYKEILRRELKGEHSRALKEIYLCKQDKNSH